MKKILIISLLALMAGFTSASATMVTAPALAAAGTVVISTPATGATIVVKGCTLCNDTATALCVHFYDSYVSTAMIKGSLCAATNACASTPSLASGNPVANINGLGQFFGEVFRLAGQFVVTSSTPTSAAAGGATLSCSYLKPLR